MAGIIEFSGFSIVPFAFGLRGHYRVMQFEFKLIELSGCN